MLKLTDYICLGTAAHEDEFIGLRLLEEKIYLGKGAAPSYIDILLSGVSPLVLTNAIEGGLNYLKLFGGTELVPETYLDTVTLGGGCEQRNLPSEYTQVDYLESSGTQYIDLGYPIDGTMSFNLKTRCLNTGFVFGNRTTNNSNVSSLNYDSIDELFGIRMGNTVVYNSTKWTENTDYEIYISDSDIKIDGTTVSTAAYGTSFYSGNAYLFTINNNGAPGSSSFSINRIYYFQMFKNGVLTQNLIPCRRNSDNVLGMYDTITGNFLTNSGTGTFTAGSDTVPTPDYPMDIWCNNGILKVSPNLFNKSLVPDENEYINRSSGIISTPTSGEFRHSDYITIKENTQYYVGIITSVATSAGLAFYDDTKTYISGISLTQLASDNNIITSPNYTKYIRFSFRTDEGYNTNWQNTVYLVEGNQPLAEFMPYGAIYTDGTVEQVTDSLGNTASAEMLLGIDTYKDTQEVLNGAVTRNIGVTVLNGTESWGVQSNQTSVFYCSTTDEAVSGSEAICSHYTGLATNVPFSMMTNNIIKHGHSTNNSRIYVKDTRFTTASEFEQFLNTQYANGTPVIITFPLATATTSSVSGQFLSKSPVTQTAGSIDNLPIAITESSHTAPTPQQPLDIVSNNGVLKLSPNVIQGEWFINQSRTSNNGSLYNLDNAVASDIFPVQSNTTYTVCYNGVANNARWYEYGENKTYIANSYVANSQTLTTSSNTKYISISFVGTQLIDVVTQEKYKLCSVNKGNVALPYMPYGAIYTDGTIETVEVTGKNLFDKDDDTNLGSWYPASGVISTAGANRTLVMRCQPNTTYYFKHCTYTGGLRAFYTEVENWEIGSPCSVTSGASYDEPNKVYSITTSANAKWLFVLFGRRDTDITATFEEQASDYMLSTDVLTAETPYEPYFNGGNATAEMLLKVGDYKDEQKVLSGSVTRNIGIKVLDGSEEWRAHASIAGWFQFSEPLVYGGIAPALCTHYPYDSAQGHAGVFFSTGRDNPQTSRIIIADNVNFPNTGMRTEFKQFLADQYNAGTPVIVVYPLAESTTEFVTAQPLTVQTGTNIVTITQASIDNLTMELSYKAGAVVTVTEIQNAQLSNSVEVTIQ